MAVARRVQVPPFTALLALLALGLPFLAHSLRGSRVLECDDHSREAHWEDELEKAIRLANQCTQERARVVLLVSQGRMSLLEAAARWADLNRRPWYDMRLFQEAHPGASDEEKYCRGMIEMVANLLAEQDPCQAEAVRAQLEHELDDHLRRGPLTLPEPASWSRE